MTKERFRLVLVLYVLASLGSLPAWYFTHYSGVPEDVLQAERSMQDVIGFTGVLEYGAAVAILLSSLIGIIGLFARWRPARHFFLAAHVMAFLVTLLVPSWRVFTNWELVANGVVDLLGVGILVICYSRLGTEVFGARRPGQGGTLVFLLVALVVAGSVAATAWLHMAPARPIREGAPVWENMGAPPDGARTEIVRAIRAYREEHGAYPQSLDDLQPIDLPSGISTSCLASFAYRKVGSGYELRWQFGVIGVTLGSRRDIRRITAVLPGSPAAKAGVAVGDYVLAVDGNDVTSATPSDFVRSVRGPVGTDVTLTLRRKGSGKIESVTLTRSSRSR